MLSFDDQFFPSFLDLAAIGRMEEAAAKRCDIEVPRHDPDAPLCGNHKLNDYQFKYNFHVMITLGQRSTPHRISCRIFRS